MEGTDHPSSVRHERSPTLEQDTLELGPDTTREPTGSRSRVVLEEERDVVTTRVHIRGIVVGVCVSTISPTLLRLLN